jgi:hypothetical protein
MGIPGHACQRARRRHWLSPRSCSSFPRVSPSTNELEAFAARVAQDLCTGADAPVKGPQRAVAAALVATLQANFRAEAAIEREVDQQIAKLGSSARGMDQDKLRSGLRERIAKQRGFVL